MNISKVSMFTPKISNAKKLAAAAMMTVGVLAGAHAATKVNNKNNNVTPPTNVETVQKAETETKKENPFADLLINLGMGTAVIGGAGALLLKGEKEHAEILNEIYAESLYKDVDANKAEK